MSNKKTFIRDLMDKMTIEEKIGQLYQTAIMGEFDYGPGFEKNDLSALIKQGSVGSLIGPYDNSVSIKLQKLAVEQSRLGIPLLFDNDIIHGCRTGFPVNIALAGSFDLPLVEKSVEAISFETSHSGTHVTLAPMIDVAKDPRWGRVVESAGEDPYLAQEMAKTYVKGWVGHDVLDGNHVGVCLKHFVGYGAVEAGREYNHVDFGERMLKQVYLKSFKAGVEAGAHMVMTSFNVYNDIPVTANKYLLRDVLRDELGFKGVTISDYTSSEEIMNHKITDSRSEVAKLCLKAGLDIELISTTYIEELSELSKTDADIKDKIDEACYRVLELKQTLGLFENPFRNLYEDFESYWLLEENRKIALEMSKASIVLLENHQALPLENHQKVLLTGPFAKTNQLVGPWGGKVRNEDCITVFEGLNKSFKNLLVAETPLKSISNSQMDEILELAKDQDVIIMTLGENQWDSGEAHSKTNIEIEATQVLLLKQLKALGKKVIGIVFAGRPMVLTNIKDSVDGLLYAWFLGTETGDAISEVLLGNYNPSAKLTMTFPRSVGQIPIYYNHMRTGRPLDDINNHYATRYLDSVNEPLYPFGYGLSYSKFSYKDIKIERKNKKTEISFDITNVSNVDGYDIPLIFIEALTFSVTRPVNELKNFKKVLIKAFESVHVNLELQDEDFKYFNKDMIETHENRKYKVKLAKNAEEIIYEQTIELS